MPDNARQLERQNAALTRQLLEWLAAAPRRYDEAMETWRSSCPRHTIWEDALEAGLVEVREGGRVEPSAWGWALLRTSPKL